MAGDLWSIVEAVYRLDRGPSDRWLRQLLETLRPHLDHGLGVLGYQFDAGAMPALSISHLTGIGMTDRELAITSRILAAARAPNERTRRVFALNDGCGTASEVMTPRIFERMPHLAALARTSAIRDFFGIVAIDPGGHGCVINAPLARPTRTLPAQRRRWGRVAAHIAAALRLRRAARSLAVEGREPAPRVDAIFDPHGRVQHLDPAMRPSDARAELSDAVRRREHARSVVRRLQPDEALAEWSALIGGQWSLLDEVESDGRRFILARRNAAPAVPLGKLTRDQAQVVGFALLGHSNKLIAYELGITETCVAMRLRRAAQGLGVTSRIALIRRARQLLERTP